MPPLAESKALEYKITRRLSLPSFTLPHAPCEVVAGVARVDSGSAAGYRVAFTAPAAVGARANLSLWASIDALTWTAPLVSIWPGPAAYSDIVPINATHIGILFESSSDAAPLNLLGVFVSSL